MDSIDNEKSLLYSTFYSNNIDNNDCDFINILKKNLDYTLKCYLIKFILKSERDGVFPILLFTKSYIEEIKILLEEYFKKMDISFINFTSQTKENKVKSILGLNIPMIYDSICKLIIASKEIINEFYRR